MPNPDSYEIGVNWNNDGVTFVNEAALAVSFRTASGRPDEFAQGETGDATILLSNEDGRFTPERAAGPLFGNLEPGRRIRIRATQTPTTHDLWNGYIIRVVPDPVTQMCTLECEDGMRSLSRFHLNQALAENQLVSQRVSDILDTVGIPAGDRNIAAAQTTSPASYWRNTDALTAILECVYNELGGFFYVAPDGKYTFEDRHKRPKSALAFTLVRGGGFRLDYDRRDDQVYDRATLQAAGQTAGIAGSQIWSRVPLPVFIAGGDTLESDINYDTAAKDVITPVATTDFVGSANQDGTGADRTANLSTTKFTDFSGGAEWNLKNIGATGLWLQKQQIRGTPFELPTDLNTVTRSATGGTSPFASAYVPSGFGLITSRSLLGSYAEYIVNRYKTPQPLLHVTLQGATAAQLTQMLARRLSDRVKITDTGPDWASFVDGEFFIERVVHTMQVDDQTGQAYHKTEWTLSSFLLDQFWVLGTDALGTSTILGY